MVVLQKNREDVEENLQIINNKPRNQSHDFKERGGVRSGQGQNHNLPFPQMRTRLLTIGNPETVGGDKKAEVAYSEADPPDPRL